MRTALRQTLLRLRLHWSMLLRRLRSGSARPQRSSPGGEQHIDPLVVARDMEAFREGVRGAGLTNRLPQHQRALRDGGGRMDLRRFCLCCNQATAMLVDLHASWEQADGSPIPNWRESLVCSRCGMNSRQRLVAKLVQQAARERGGARIYLTEQVTPIYDWVRRLPEVDVQGSEYLGPQYRGGEQVAGLRHEDIMALSHADAAFDVIVSNDVLEHIPDAAAAFRECRRVLRPCGVMLATFPFHADRQGTLLRARVADAVVEHLHPPQYHGNPVSAVGSLVFHDFGWDLLDVLRQGCFACAA
jgi:hypothetical protein